MDYKKLYPIAQEREDVIDSVWKIDISCPSQCLPSLSPPSALFPLGDGHKQKGSFPLATWALWLLLGAAPSNNRLWTEHVSVWVSVSEEQPKYPHSIANLLTSRGLHIFFIYKPPCPESHYTAIAVAGMALELSERCRKDGW